MALKQMNARDLILEVSDMATSPTWTGIGALLTMTTSPNEHEEMTDTTTVDDDGFYRQEKMQVGAKLAVEGRFLQDPITGVRDIGQALVETLAGRLAYDSQVNIRFRYPGATTWKAWAATVSVGDQGGGVNDKTSWSAEFIRCGAATAPVVV